MATYNTKTGTVYDDRTGRFIGQRDSSFRGAIKDLLIEKIHKE